MRILIFKELLASVPIVVLALLAHGWMVQSCVQEMRQGAYSVMTVSSVNVTAPMSLASNSQTLFVTITIGLAAILGLISGSADNSRQMWQFVLFRPIARRTYVLAKMGTGLLVIVATSAVPIVIFMAYESSPGFRAAPYVWQAFLPLWEGCGLGACVFCGAFLSSVRTASWWWSKLWPMVSVGLVSWWFWISPYVGAPGAMTLSQTAYWILCGAIVLGVTALCVRVIEERDFA